MNQFEKLAYDPITGLLTWRVSRGPVKAGTVAGTIDTNGYVRVRYDNQSYPAHRIAWLLTYGAWPLGELDHKNGNKADNRLENLREVTHSVNGQNQRRARGDNKTSGLLGASWDAREKKWRAQITVNGKRKNLGRFHTPEDAHTAYVSAKRLQHVGCTI